MDIAEVAKRSGLRASTLRYYEEKGLIQSMGQPGERRRFAPGVMDQLALIALGQSAGFSLDEIRSMFLPGGEPHIDRMSSSEKPADCPSAINASWSITPGANRRRSPGCPIDWIRPFSS